MTGVGGGWERLPVLQELLSSLSPGGRSLSRRTQIVILAVVGIAGAVLLGVGPALWHVLGVQREVPQATAQETPGTFRPTEAQWAGLKIATIKAMTFRMA